MNMLLSSTGKTAIENINLICKKSPEDIRLAWIITAAKSDSNACFLDADLQIMLKSGINPHLYDISKKTYDEFEDELGDFDVLFMEGGNTFYLMRRIRETGFDRYLDKWVKNGRPYLGASAGSYIVCPTVEMSTWKKADRNRYGLNDLNGLGYVDFLITAHYKDEYKDLVQKGASKTSYPLKVLKDGQALLVQDGGVELIGDQDEVKLN
jgi:dipeptidase E